MACISALGIALNGALVLLHLCTDSKAWLEKHRNLTRQIPNKHFRTLTTMKIMVVRIRFNLQCHLASFKCSPRCNARTTHPFVVGVNFLEKCRGKRFEPLVTCFGIFDGDFGSADAGGWLPKTEAEIVHKKYLFQGWIVCRHDRHMSRTYHDAAVPKREMGKSDGDGPMFAHASFQLLIGQARG